MDWLGIFSLIVSVLLIPLLRKDILFFIPDISQFLIKKTTRILPSGYYQKRYEEEFLGRIERYNGSFCQLICAISCSWGCLEIFTDLLDQFSEPFQYEVSGQDISGEGCFTFKPNFLNPTLSVSGELKQISETDGRKREVSIPWQSTQIKFLDVDRIKISYEILDLDSNWIRGHFIGKYSEQEGFSGALYRKLKSEYKNKYQQLRFRAKRNNTNSSYDSRVKSLVKICRYFSLLVYFVKSIWYRRK